MQYIMTEAIHCELFQRWKRISGVGACLQVYMCVSCQCNGHSDICDKDRGDNCDCKNNTKSPRCETGEISMTACWKFQVSYLY